MVESDGLEKTPTPTSISISAVTTRCNTREESLMNRVDRFVSDETELGREKEHIRKALQVNGYPDWKVSSMQQ